MRKSAEAGLKNAQNQAKDQCKKLYHTKIKLAIEKQQLLELKVELQKAKEATEALEQVFYGYGVQETEIQLTEELTEVCRDYYKEVWGKALNWAGVPAASEWRNAENIFYPKDIREVPTVLLPPAALALTSFEQPSTT